MHSHKDWEHQAGGASRRTYYNASQLRTETSRVQIEGAVVRLEDGKSTVWGPFTVPGSGFIDPASGGTPSYGLTEAILLGSNFVSDRVPKGILDLAGVGRHLHAEERERV